MVRYAVLGPVEVCQGAERASVGGPKQVALLADLLVNANEAVSVDRLIDDVWGPQRSDGSAKRLQMGVARLRSALGPRADGSSPLQRAPRGYRLIVAPGELDADVFERYLEDAAAALRGGDPAAARDAVRAGLGLWRGPALAEVAYESWAQEAVRRLEERRLDALETYVDADLALGHHADAIGRLRVLVAEHPFRERFSWQLMLALYRAGRQQEALDAYQRTRERLQELGLEPGSALTTLQRQILSHDGALAGSAPELPAALRGLPTCVGRVDEAALVGAAVRAAAAGSRTIVCIGGEPGVGKTLLAGRTAVEAHDDGFAVAWGASTESLRPPYGAWLAPLSQLTQDAPSTMPDADRDILAPLIGSAETAPAHGPAADPDSERYRLFNAVVRLLRGISAVAPVVVVLDDLHWADSDSLALLQYIAREPPDGLRVSIVVTYRDSELGWADQLRDLLTDLHGVPGTTRLHLTGLGAAEVAAMVAARSKHAAYRAGRRIIDEITAETGGNPFFVGEIMRHLEESKGDWRQLGSIARLDLPASVSELVRRRVQRIGARAEEVLGAAAVVGQQFDVDMLERLVGHDPLDVLEAAESAAVLRSDGVGRYAFTHAIVNHAVYGALSPTRRARWHCRVAEALEDDPGADPGALAYHWARTGVGHHQRRAIGYARLAGQRALEQLAPDEAERWFTDAHAWLLEHGGEESERCDVLVGLGEAKRRVGDATFRDDLLEATRIAAREGDLERLTSAVLANTLGPFGAAGVRDQARLEALERALELVPDDWPKRPLMLAVLARELYFGGDAPRGSQLSLTALARARRLDDRRELARVMAMATAISPLAPLEAHEQLVSELTELADRIGDPELRFRAANAAFIYGMHAGEPVALAAGLHTMRAADEELHQPILHWTRLWADSAERTLAGDLAGGEKLTMEAELDAIRHGRPQAELVTFGQLLSIRTDQAALDDLRDRLDALTAANPHLPVLRLARGFIDAETGHLAPAEALLRRAAAAGFNFPFDRTLAFSLARCADIALRVHAVDVASELYDRLLPHRDQFATPAGLSSRGSVELSLGRLSTMLGRLDAAEDHLLRAERAHERLRAPLLQARSALASAEALLARGNHERARQLLDRALRLAPASEAVAREAQALAGMHAHVAPS